MLPGMELMACPNLAVPREVMHHVVRVESSYNPYAIGVVGGRLVRQPRNLPEALSTARMLEERGYNFSLGLAQVNRYNLVKYGLHSYEKAFHPCSNLVAGSQILRECYGRSGGDWGKSFSCYYSGDFRTGYRHGYVQKVYASMRRGNAVESGSYAGASPIQVVDSSSRRIAAFTPTQVASQARGGVLDEPVAVTLLQRRSAAAARQRSTQSPGSPHVIPDDDAPAAESTMAVTHPAQVAPAPSVVPIVQPSQGQPPQWQMSGSPVRVSASPMQVSASVPRPPVMSTDTAFVF